MGKNPDNKGAIEVKRRLMAMNDLVVEEVLLHKRCNTNYFSESGNQHSDGDLGRKPDKGRVKLFKELCNWLKEEIKKICLHRTSCMKSLFPLTNSR